MKKGPLHFLSRKNNSLFDTNVKMKDMDNVELVLGSSAIPESGTASVRARPTVKHHSSSYDSFQGFAVPTPKVPLLPPVNGPKINGSVGGDHLTNGSVMSVPDLTESDVFVPPHPSMAPPLPPGAFLPPPDFMGDLNTLDLSTLQPPPMPAPKPPSMAPSLQEEDFTFLKPPPMAPPKPPSTSSSSSMSSVPISNPPSSIVPDHPKFAPPQPPTERQSKISKTPPPKPIRLSSMSNLDSPPQTPAPPPPVQTPTLSTFNPQNKAKLYHVPTTSILKGYEEPDTRPKQKLLLEDSSSVKTSPVLVRVDDKVPKVATPSKPVLKDSQELKDNLQILPPPQTSLPEPNKEATMTRVSTPPIDKPLRNSYQTSPSLPKVNGTSVNSEPVKKLEVSPSPSHKFSPLLDRKLRNLKSSETHGAKEGPAASPLALLMAAKKREKQRTTHSLSRENSATKDEEPNENIQPSDSSPNSFVVTPRSSSSSSLTSQDRVPESPKPVGPGNYTQTVQTPNKPSSSPLFKRQTPSSSPNLRQMSGSPSLTNLVAKAQNKEKSPSKPQASIDETGKVDINLPVLPPPPEFDDLDDIVGPPPAITPPDPPRKTAPAPAPAPALAPAPAPAFNPPPPPAPALIIPPPPPKPKPPQAPKFPPPDTAVKPKPQAQTKPKVGPNHIPSNLSPSQVTLLSILQKKMAEMDHKMNPTKENEANSDDWGNPLSDEENKAPIFPKVTLPSKNNTGVNKTAGLDMRELEGKMVRKHQDTSSVRSPTSNGVHSKHQYGMTFTVRPGTKNPISPWTSAES